MHSKYQDPLRVLLEFIASVSLTDPFCVFTVNSHNFYHNMDGVAGHRLQSGGCPRLRSGTNSENERWD